MADSSEFFFLPCKKCTRIEFVRPSGDSSDYFIFPPWFCFSTYFSSPAMIRDVSFINKYFFVISAERVASYFSKVLSNVQSSILTLGTIKQSTTGSFVVLLRTVVLWSVSYIVNLKQSTGNDFIRRQRKSTIFFFEKKQSCSAGFSTFILFDSIAASRISQETSSSSQ